jgi:hypothetical protein
MYTIYWEAKNGVTGNGIYPIKYNDTKAWVDYSNDKYPEIKHFIKPE